MKKRVAKGAANKGVNSVKQSTFPKQAELDYPFNKYGEEGSKQYEKLCKKQKNLVPYEKYLFVTHFPNQKKRYDAAHKATEARGKREKQKQAAEDAQRRKKSRQQAIEQAGMQVMNSSPDDDAGLAAGVKVHVIYTLRY